MNMNGNDWESRLRWRTRSAAVVEPNVSVAVHMGDLVAALAELERLRKQAACHECEGAGAHLSMGLDGPIVETCQTCQRAQEAEAEATRLRRALREILHWADTVKL